jgi:hypothetical protein
MIERYRNSNVEQSSPFEKLALVENWLGADYAFGVGIHEPRRDLLNLNWDATLRMMIGKIAITAKAKPMSGACTRPTWSTPDEN